MSQRIEYVNPNAIEFRNELDLADLGVEDPHDEDVLVIHYDEIIVIPGGYDDQIDLAERIRTTVKNQTGRDGRAVRTGERLPAAKVTVPTYRATFTTPFEQHADREGQPFTVLHVIDRADETHNAEVLPMYRIRFADGFETDAWPEEVLDECETCDNTGSVTIEDGHGHSATTECWDCDRGKGEVTISLAPIHAEEGTTYTPFTDGWGVGYEVTAEGKPTRWVYLYPSQTDSLDEANVFVYLDAHRPTVDQPPVEPECYISIWPEPNDD